MKPQAWPKAIIHLDMDAFYPSVEVLDNPDLKDKPVIVGGSKERGVVSSASYEARRFGIHSAQPIAKALRLCPGGIFLPVRMSRYQEISGRVFKIFRHFTPLVETLSIDEAFLDVTGSMQLFGPPEEMAMTIKNRVREETGLTVSAGVAPSKFVAKIASDLDKPDGLTVVSSARVKTFLEALSVSKMWGVGKKTQEMCYRLGIRTIGDLARFPVEVLQTKLGKHGIRMHELARGIDGRDVVPVSETKSVGNEKTFSKDIFNLDLARKELLALTNKVSRRIRSKEIEGKTITLKVKYSDFSQVTRSKTLPKPTDDAAQIYACVCDLLKKTQAGKRSVRLLGVSVSQLVQCSNEAQLSLFEKNKDSQKRKDLSKALDNLTKRYGEDAILPAALLED